MDRISEILIPTIPPLLKLEDLCFSFAGTNGQQTYRTGFKFIVGESGTTGIYPENAIDSFQRSSVEVAEDNDIRGLLVLGLQPGSDVYEPNSNSLHSKHVFRFPTPIFEYLHVVITISD